jgi:hypothetical protein
MSALPFTPRYTAHNGDVINPLGRVIPITEAAEMADIWQRQALRCDVFGKRELARLFARDSLALQLAASAAQEWRRNHQSTESVA